MSPQAQAVANGSEKAWLTEAIELATSSVTEGGGPFGALIISADEIVATGNNLVTATLDPTAHAEVSAIRNGCRELGRFSLAGCVLVTSCEPCPMCLTSAFWSRLDEIVFAADRHDAAKAGFDDRTFHDLFAFDDDAALPTSVRRVEMSNRTKPFEAWLATPNRIEY